MTSKLGAWFGGMSLWWLILVGAPWLPTGFTILALVAYFAHQHEKPTN